MGRTSAKMSKTRTATPQRVKRASRKSNAVNDEVAADEYNTEDHMQSVKYSRRSKLKRPVFDSNNEEDELLVNESSSMSIIDPDNNADTNAAINEKATTTETDTEITNDILQDDNDESNSVIEAEEEKSNTESTLVKSNTNYNMLNELVHLKELLTAPFVLYNSQTRKVEANPEYNSTIVLELSRLQGVMITIVRKALQESTEFTPKELLFACERALLYTYVNAIRLDSLLSTELMLSSESESNENKANVNTAASGESNAHSASQSILSALNQHNSTYNNKYDNIMNNIKGNKNARMSLSYSVVDDQAASKYASMMETHYGQRNASPIVMISLGHVLSAGNAQRDLHQLVELLSNRIAHELEDKSSYSKKTHEERTALQSTRNNVEDLQLLLQDVATAYKAVHTK